MGLHSLRELDGSVINMQTMIWLVKFKAGDDLWYSKTSGKFLFENYM